MGELASRFRNAGRVLKDDEDNDGATPSDNDEPSIQPLSPGAKEAIEKFRQAVSSAAKEQSAASPSLPPSTPSPADANIAAPKPSDS